SRSLLGAEVGSGFVMSSPPTCVGGSNHRASFSPLTALQATLPVATRQLGPTREPAVRPARAQGHGGLRWLVQGSDAGRIASAAATGRHTGHLQKDRRRPNLTWRAKKTQAISAFPCERRKIDLGSGRRDT